MHAEALICPSLEKEYSTISTPLLRGSTCRQRLSASNPSMLHFASTIQDCPQRDNSGSKRFHAGMGRVFFSFFFNPLIYGVLRAWLNARSGGELEASVCINSRKYAVINGLVTG